MALKRWVMRDAPELTACSAVVRSAMECPNDTTTPFFLEKNIFINFMLLMDGA